MFVAIMTLLFSQVLECFLEVRNKTLTEKPVKLSPRPSSAGKEGIDVETALREMDRYNAMTEREKSDFNMSGDGVLRSTTETPMSPTSPGAGGPPLAAAASSRKKSAFGSSNGTYKICFSRLFNIFLFSFFLLRWERHVTARHVDQEDREGEC